MYRSVLRHLRDGGQLADLGCGEEARFLRLALPRVARGWGLDSAVDPLDEGRLTLVRADLTRRLPFGDDILDQITCLSLLEHLDEPIPLLRECFRCLRPGGRLIVATPSRLGVLVHELLRRLCIVAEPERRDFWMSPERLAGWLAHAGFEVETAYRLGFGADVLAVGLKP